MSKNMPEPSVVHSANAQRHEWLWSTVIALSALLAACAVVYLLSLPVPLVH